MDINLTSYEQDMLTTYQREKTIVPYARTATPFLNAMKEVGTRGMKPAGNVLEFQLRLHQGFGVGTPNDGGDWAKARTHKSIKAQVTRAMLDAALRITVEAQAAAADMGSFTGDALADAVKNCLDVFYYQANVLSLGHGTGRLAVVAADSVTDTVIMDLPDGAFALREGAFVEFADIDVGGTVQNLGAVGLEVQIESIDHTTHTVTFTDAITVSAGWGVYLATTYGKRKPNGLRTFIDDGTLTATVMNITRATNPQVNATIIDGGGALQDYNEALPRTLLTRIKQRSGVVPTHAWSNEGIRGEHYRFTTPDRMFTIVGTDKSVPAYNIGANEDELAIHFGGRRIPMLCDEDMPARSLYFSYGPGWRSHTLIDDDWVKGTKGILHWAPAAGGETYSNNQIGEMQGCKNVSHTRLNGQGALLNVRDRDSAGD